MLVNVTHVEESRVAILEDGVLAAYEIETINRTSIKGNIYNAVVESVHQSLEAAFVRIGPDMKGFLPLDEVNFFLLPARVEDRSRGKIAQHLNPGQRLMVQVVREPFAGKPPTVSTYFSLPGRYLVLMPGVDSSGVSRKIEDSAQRERLKKIIDELKPPEGFGVIVRTAGLGQTKAELQRDLRYLLRLWESIQKGSASAEFPGPVYRERDLVIRTIRDHLTPDIREVWIDSEETYKHTMGFMRDVMPNKTKTLRLYSGERPLFNKYNLEEQIETIYKRRVPLPSGGEIVIDGTEALTAIDVNSARSKSKTDAEENAAKTNLEAASEIARQLRLRDLGGLVVVDFIDMASLRNRKKVEKAMKDAMKGDKAKHDVTRLSKLGLMEIARQRIKGEKMGASYATCPTCEGYGLVKNIEAAALSALRKLQTRCSRGNIGRLRVGLPPGVAGWILNHKRGELLEQERRNDLAIVIEAKPSLLRHESEFETFPREKTESPPQPAVEDEAIAASPSTALPPEKPEAAGPSRDAAAPSPRKRRRRRKRTATQETASEADTVEAPAETRGTEPIGEEKAVTERPDDPPAPVQAEGVRGGGSEGDDAPGEEKGAVVSSETSGSPPAEDGEVAAGGPVKRRKRRRRKRRPRATSDEGTGSGDKGAGGSGGGTLVPAKVNINELMPAAVGRGDHSKGKSRKPPAPKTRRRRKPAESAGPDSPAGSRTRRKVPAAPFDLED
jgi:ribonuclease E